MACEGLVFGTPQGILNATYSGTAEAIRHEIGTATGLTCDCEKVLRATAQITLSTDTLGNGGPVAVAAAGFTFTGTAVCTSREVTYSREAFVQDSATYELITGGNCASVTTDDQQTPGECPAGWSTEGTLLNGTYTETRELMKHEDVYGTGESGSPLLRINAIYVLRIRKTVSATYDRDPGLGMDILGTIREVTLSSADGNRTNTVSGIVTSYEMTKNREGFATYAISVESQDCA